MQDFRKLVVWQKAHEWVLAVYRFTKKFPDDERYGLTSQLRRAAASVPANLAEACGRNGQLEFSRFVQIAMGSVTEAEYHVLLAKDLGYVGGGEYDHALQSIQEVKRMLTALLKTVRARTANTSGRKNNTEN